MLQSLQIMDSAQCLIDLHQDPLAHAAAHLHVSTLRDVFECHKAVPGDNREGEPRQKLQQCLPLLVFPQSFLNFSKQTASTQRGRSFYSLIACEAWGALKGSEKIRQLNHTTNVAKIIVSKFMNQRGLPKGPKKVRQQTPADTQSQSH